MSTPLLSSGQGIPRGQDTAKRGITDRRVGTRSVQTIRASHPGGRGRGKRKRERLTGNGGEDTAEKAFEKSVVRGLRKLEVFDMVKVLLELWRQACPWASMYGNTMRRRSAFDFSSALRLTSLPVASPIYHTAGLRASR